VIQPLPEAPAPETAGAGAPPDQSNGLQQQAGKDVSGRSAVAMSVLSPLSSTTQETVPL